MMKSINRLLFVRRQQGDNLLHLRTLRPICPVRQGAVHKWTDGQLIQPTAYG